MSITASELTPADIAACTCGGGNGNNGGNGWGGDWSMWIILFLIFAAFGWGNNGNGGLFGGGGRGSNGGALDNYVLASDFSQLSRQMSDGFSTVERRTDSIINGICDLGYTQQSLANTINMNVAQNGYESRLATQTLGSQLAQCCCEIREGISGVNYNMATQANGISRQIADCCCDVERQVERGFADTNYNMATQNCQTLQAIDKVGDRVIDYLANEKMQTLRDENQALRLAASQARQNEYLVERLNPNPCPTPAYVVQPPQQVTFPTNCCGQANYASGCGCNG